MEKEYYITGLRFQKSQNFLYPLLGFKRDALFRPECTYLYWSEADYSIEDYSLLVYYKTDRGEDFRKYEKNEILTKNNVIACFEVEGGMLYVFDMVEWSEAVANFMQGAYSKYLEKDKKKIMHYFGESNLTTVRPGRIIHLALFPELYYSVVAEEMEVAEKDVSRELVDKFNFEDEVCYVPIIQNKNCECDNKTFFLGSGT